MSAVDTAAPEQAVANGSPPVDADAAKTRHDIFKYAEYVHVGDGAQECELAVALANPERKLGDPVPVCSDQDHFHAWCRLPNPFQVRDISEKARAARARRIRMLKDADADAHVILEEELDALRELSGPAREILADELVEQDFPTDYDAAMGEVMDIEVEDFVPEGEDDEIPKLYANILQDQEEYARQTQLPDDQREEDYPELEKTVTAYSEAVNDALEKIQKPKRDNFLSKSNDELVDIIRQKRIDLRGTEAYLHTYNSWQWFVCTFKIPPRGRPHERVWKDITQFKYDTPSDVVREVQATFSNLESRMAGDRAGNS